MVSLTFKEDIIGDTLKFMHSHENQTLVINGWFYIIVLN